MIVTLLFNRSNGILILELTSFLFYSTIFVLFLLFSSSRGSLQKSLYDTGKSTLNLSDISAHKQIDRCLFFCWPWVSIWFSSAGAQPRSAEEVAALDEDFYQRDIAAEYEDLDFDAREQFDVDDVYLGQNEVDAGGGSSPRTTTTTSWTRTITRTIGRRPDWPVRPT